MGTEKKQIGLDGFPVDDDDKNNQLDTGVDQLDIGISLKNSA